MNFIVLSVKRELVLDAYIVNFEASSTNQRMIRLYKAYLPKVYILQKCNLFSLKEKSIFFIFFFSNSIHKLPYDYILQLLPMLMRVNSALNCALGSAGECLGKTEIMLYRLAL